MKPLCVDLDGTLIKTDLLVESLLIYLKERPANLLKILPLRSKSQLKEHLGKNVSLSVEHLPYNLHLIDYLRSLSDREIILITGSHEIYAKKVFEHLGIFKSFHGTTLTTNLTGINKMNFLVNKFGEKGFDYIGNSKEDIPVWEMSENAFSVVDKKWPIKNISLMACPHSPNKLKLLLKLLRIHQWSKNFLIFLPLILAHKFKFDLNIFLAFFSFSLIASSVYILNDILDIESDRRHPTKRNRPIPSGEVSILSSIMIFFTLVISSFLINSFITTPESFLFPALYLLANIFYSSVLKKILIVDIVILSSFYLFRILYGGHVSHTEISQWLLSFSFFIFFSLAVIKRYTEVLTLFKKQGQKYASGRAYEFDDLPVLLNLGVSSGIASIIVLSLYFKFGVNPNNYPSPQYLWGVQLLILTWIADIWTRTARGKMDDDPVKFAIKDRLSIAIFVLVTIFTISATI